MFSKTTSYMPLLVRRKIEYMVYLDHKIGKQLILLPNLGVIPSSNNTAKQNTADCCRSYKHG